MSILNQERLKEKHSGRMIAILCVMALCMIFFAIRYWNYMLEARSTVPIMDYWHWIAVYGQKVHAGTITFSDYFFSDVGEHIQPLVMALQFLVLKASHFDVRPLVMIGAAVRIFVAAAIVLGFLRYCSRSGVQNLPLLFLIAVGLFVGVLNYNQWEMTTEPFSFANSIRVLCYYGSFAWTAQLLLKFSSRSRRQNCLQAALLGVFCALLTVLLSAAYFVGHLTAIGLVLLGSAVKNWKKRKDYIAPVLIWGIISFLGAVFYFWLFTRGGRMQRGGTEIGLKTMLLLLSEAVVMYFGAILLPQSLSEQYGAGPACILGTLILVYIVYLFVRYYKNQDQEKSVFPVLCVLYALILSAAISWGRVGQFGAITMTSSRYVIESSIGLTGILWMSYDCFKDAARKSLQRWSGVAVCVVVLALLGYSAQKEWKTAPYRAAYNAQIEQLLLDIDNVSDDELAITQGSADDVRSCVAFFREHNLSIFYQK